VTSLLLKNFRLIKCVTNNKREEARGKYGGRRGGRQKKIAEGWTENKD